MNYDLEIKVKPLIIQAMPGSGKTTESRKPGVSDVDDIIREMFQIRPSKQTTDTILSSPPMRIKLAYAIDSTPGIVLSNIDPVELGLRAAWRVAYRVEDYVPHLALAKRTDLLERFSDSELESWAQAYVGKENVLFLRRGQFLADALKRIVPFYGL